MVLLGRIWSFEHHKPERNLYHYLKIYLEDDKENKIKDKEDFF